jgi:putative endonuclease
VNKAIQGQNTSSKARGDRAEQLALEHLQQHGLCLVARNFKTRGRGGGEIDLIMRDPCGTLVFVEVRQRRSWACGGAGASIDGYKWERIVHAARCFLSRFAAEPPCRFDVVLLQGVLYEKSKLQIEWLQGAFAL